MIWGSGVSVNYWNSISFKEDLSFKDDMVNVLHQSFKSKAALNGGLNVQRVESDEEMGMNG